jgi:hypothetical protein
MPRTQTQCPLHQPNGPYSRHLNTAWTHAALSLIPTTNATVPAAADRRARALNSRKRIEHRPDRSESALRTSAVHQIDRKADSRTRSRETKRIGLSCAPIHLRGPGPEQGTRPARQCRRNARGHKRCRHPLNVSTCGLAPARRDRPGRARRTVPMWSARSCWPGGGPPTLCNGDEADASQQRTCGGESTRKGEGPMPVNRAAMPGTVKPGADRTHAAR